MGNKRGVYEIRFRERRDGKNGGAGHVKSFLATLSKGSAKEASKKLRCKNAEILGVTKR